MVSIQIPVFEFWSILFAFCLFVVYSLSISILLKHKISQYPTLSHTLHKNMDLFLKGRAWKALKLRLQTPAIQRDDHLVNYGEQIIEQCRSWSYSPTSGVHKPARLKSPVYLYVYVFPFSFTDLLLDIVLHKNSLLAIPPALRTQSFFRCRENFNPKTNYIKSVS